MNADRAMATLGAGSCAALVSMLCGCASLELYPVCQYAGAVDEAAAARFTESVGTVLARLEEAPASKVAPALVAERRYMAIQTAPWRHVEMRRHWVELGCVGRYTNPEDRAKYAACREYVVRALARQTPGAAEDDLLCFTSDGCQGRRPRPAGGDADAVIYCNGS